MIICKFTKKGGCSEKHRTKCNGLVINCDEYKPDVPEKKVVDTTTKKK